MVVRKFFSVLFFLFLLGVVVHGESGSAELREVVIQGNASVSVSSSGSGNVSVGEDFDLLRGFGGSGKDFVNGSVVSSSVLPSSVVDFGLVNGSGGLGGGLRGDFRVSPCEPLGDVDFDGFVSDVDARLVLGHVSGELLSGKQVFRADVDGDGEVGGVDAALIFRFVAGAVDVFPGCLFCVDTDGINYSVRGFARDYFGLYEDGCEGDYLTEFYCSGTSVVAEEHFCTEGCSAGACLRQSGCREVYDAVVRHYGTSCFYESERYNVSGDVNLDGVIDSDDYGLVIRNYYDSVWCAERVVDSVDPCVRGGVNATEVNATMSIATVRAAYSVGERVELTDPPVEKESASYRTVVSLNDELVSNPQISIALERRAVMSRLIEENPDEALKAAFSDFQRDKFSQDIRGYVEKQIGGLGTVIFVHGHDFERGIVIDEYYLLFGDKMLRLFSRDLDPLMNGAQVNIRGIRIGERVAVFPFEYSAPLLEVPAVGAQRTIVVPVYFPGQENEQRPSKSILNQVVFDSVSDYYVSTSYGATWLTGNTTDWVFVNTSFDCGFLASQETINAVDPFVDFREYDRIIYFVQWREAWPCTYSGVALFWTTFSTQEGEVNLTVSANKLSLPEGYILLNYPSLVAHEFGHNLGAAHANFLNCTNNVALASSGCKNMEYGDPTDVMGTKFFEMNPPHRDELGWLSESSMMLVTEGDYTLAPLEQGEGLRVLKIPRGTNQIEWSDAMFNFEYERVGQQFLYLSYRQRLGFGFDNYTNTDVLDGLTIYARTIPYAYNGEPWRDNSYNFLIDASPLIINMPYPELHDLNFSLRVGQSFVDPATGIQVTVLSRNETALNVRVRPGLRIDFTPPQVAITFPTRDAEVRLPLVVSANATDEGGIYKVDFYTAGNGNRKFATDYEPPFEASLTNNDASSPVYALAFDRSGVPLNWPGNVAVSPLVPFTVLHTPPSIEILSPLNGSSVVNPVMLSAAVSGVEGQVLFILPSQRFDIETPPYERQVVLDAGPQVFEVIACNRFGCSNVSSAFTVASEPFVKSMINNTGETQISGLLTLKVQKSVGGEWLDERVVFNDSVSIPALSYLALDTVWSEHGSFVPEGAGLYRVSAALTANGRLISGPLGPLFVVSDFSVVQGQGERGFGIEGDFGRSSGERRSAEQVLPPEQEFPAQKESSEGVVGGIVSFGRAVCDMSSLCSRLFGI